MAEKTKKKLKDNQVSESNVAGEILPRHIGIIMDGNGRWAAKRKLPRTMGHQAGARVFRKITKYCEKIGIEYLTVYAFSTENWKRPKSEVEALMNLFRSYLKEALSDFTSENIRVHFIGDASVLSDDLQDLMKKAEEETAEKSGMTLNIAINYGGQDEILHAVRRIIHDHLSEDQINHELFESYLYTENQPPVDLILRPSGEYRLSNFMIWQSAYAEYIFMDVLWPDFKPKHLDQALEEYAKRNRRFGGI